MRDPKEKMSQILPVSLCDRRGFKAVLVRAPILRQITQFSKSKPKKR